jgi:hypothetical protein
MREENEALRATDTKSREGGGGQRRQREKTENRGSEWANRRGLTFLEGLKLLGLTQKSTNYTRY